MKWARFSFLRLYWIVLFFGVTLSAYGQLSSRSAVVLQPMPQSDRTAHVDDAALTELSGHVPFWAQNSTLSATPVNGAESIRLTLILRRAPAAEQAFQAFLIEQETPGSPVYHRAVSPQELGLLYGPTDHDIDAIEQWARSEGLSVGVLAPSRTTLTLTGTAATIEGALRLNLSMYNTASGVRRAPDTEPQIPAALSPVIRGIAGLIAENSHPLFTPPAAPIWTLDSLATDRSSPLASEPLFTGGKGAHYITPADFATIYDVNPLYAQGNLGATIGPVAQHIAIIASSDANASDVQAFFAGIGSTSYKYNVVLADGTSPGYTNSQGEAELDLERVLGTAPGVTADLVEGLGASPIYDAASYAVNTLHDPIITMSFGDCEADLTATGALLWQDLWATAASNMTSVFVSAGDAGAADCDVHGSAPPATQKLAVNGYCSTVSNTCVGGTEFNDSTNPTQYWSPTNNTNTRESAIGYIPEGAWNDPTRTDANGNVSYIVSGGGGGVSQFVQKPSWQIGTGVPADSYRDIPDIAFSASPVDDPYYYCGPGQCTVAGQSSSSTFVAFGDGGTSATAPSMAGITALLNTASGTQQGNLNPTIYRLANSAVAAQIFHDVTLASSGVGNCSIDTASLCNNSTASPGSTMNGQPGYLVGTGYDQATGWGSLDVTNFIKGAVQVSTSLALSTTGSAVATSQTISATATLTEASTSLASPTGTIQFFVNGVASGSPVVLANGAASSGVINFSTIGTDVVTAAYSGDALYLPSTSAGATVVVSAQPPTFTLTASPASLAFTSGATSGNTEPIAVSAANNYAGPVSMTCSISSSSAAFQPTCSVSPGTIALTANGTATATVTINSTTAQASLGELFTPDGTLSPNIGGPFGQRRMDAAGVGMAFTVFGLALVPFRRRRLPKLLVALLAIAALTTISGCSHGGSSAPLSSSAGSYVVTVTGIGTGVGATAPSSAATAFSVTIH